ncbi:MAG: AI-2E family transporter, partial [Bradyrhizobium sp.]
PERLIHLMSMPPDDTRDCIETASQPGRNRDGTVFIIGLIAIAFLVHELQWILLPFVVSGLIAFLCTPIVEWGAARFCKPRWVASVFVFILLMILLALAIFFIARPLMQELAHAATSVQPLIEGFAKAMLKGQSISVFGGQPMDAPQLAAAGVKALRTWVSHPMHVALIGSSIAAMFLGSFVSLVLLFYFLLNGPKLMAGMLWLAPERRRPQLREIWRRIDPLIRRYFIGVIVTVAYATFAAYLGLGLVLRIPHAVVIAILTGVLELIPVFGPIASALLAGLAAVSAAKGISLIIGYAIYAVVLRLSIDQLLGPVVLGTAARLNPSVIIFCFFAGGLLFGVIGIIMAIPVALGVRVTLSVLRGEPSQQQKAGEGAQ